MKPIFKDEGVSISYDNKTKLMLATSTPVSESFNAEKNLQVIVRIGELVEQYKPLYYLNDQRTTNYTYKVDEQREIAAVFSKSLIKAGVKKLAFVYPANIMAELALEQTVEEAGDVPIDIKFFTSLDAAKKWAEE